MVHGLNEGHIEPYTDIEFQLAKYQTYIIMKYLSCKQSTNWSAPILGVTHINLVLSLSSDQKRYHAMTVMV